MKKSIGSGRGSVYNILLKALQTGDKYGYEICKEVEEKTNGSYILKQPSLYSGLKRLEAQGDIKSYWRDSALGGRRHYYSLTEKGRERINGSNFSWTDARDDIVGSLFEMSETDKQIESVTSEIDSLKSVYETNQEEQNAIDNVLKKTEKLVGTENIDDNRETNFDDYLNATTNDQSSTVYTQSDDLFSIFSNFNFDSNDEKDQNIEQDIAEATESKDFGDESNNQIETAENDRKFDIDDVESFAEIENEQKPEDNVESEHDVTKDGQISLFSLFDINNQNQDSISTKEDNQNQIENQLIIDEKSYNNENFNDEESRENLEIQNDLVLTQDTQENLNHSEEIKEDQKFDEILSNLQTVNIENDSEVSTLEKTQNNVLDEYFNSHISFGGFSDSTQLEEPEQNFSIYDDKAINDLFDSIDENNKIENTKTVNEQPSNSLKIDINSTDIFEEGEENDEKNLELENEQSTIHNEQSTMHFEDEEDKKIENETKNFDYRDIFGDLMSSSDDETKNQNEKIDTKETDQEDISIQQISDEISQNTEEESAPEELPRVDAKNDINRTLFFDSRIVDITSKTYESTSSGSESNSSGFERYDQTPFETDGRNPFEKYDTYTNPVKINEDSTESQQFVHTEYTRKSTNVSFDKKYANEINSFDVPDYEVRYHKKADEKAQSKFLSINKINLMTSALLFIFTYFFITLTLVLSNRSLPLPGFQIAIYVIAYVLGFALLVKDFVKYLVNKNKKVSKLNTNEKINNFAMAIITALIAICLNLVVGIDFGKFAYFTGGFMVPIYYAIALVLKYPIKKFLSGFGNFYN